MRPLRRWLLNGVTALSLLLFAVTAGVIVRSFIKTDMVEYFTRGPTVGPVLHRSRVRVVSGRGVVVVLLMDEAETTTDTADMADMAKHRDAYEGPPFWSHDIFPPSWLGPEDHQWLGYGYSDYSILNSTGWETPRSRALRVPLWLPLLLLAALPARRVGNWWRQYRRLARGACLSCGYDLRATPDRCPECGTVPATPKSGDRPPRRSEK